MATLFGDEKIDYLKKACKFGETNSCKNLGKIYANNEFIDQNLTISKDFYAKGCKFGDSVSCQNYKTLYLQGF